MIVKPLRPHMESQFDSLPKEVKSVVNKKEANEIKTKLEAAGAKVELN